MKLLLVFLTLFSNSVLAQQGEKKTIPLNETGTVRWYLLCNQGPKEDQCYSDDLNGRFVLLVGKGINEKAGISFDFGNYVNCKNKTFKDVSSKGQFEKPKGPGPTDDLMVKKACVL